MASNFVETIHDVNSKLFAAELELDSIQKLFFMLGLKEISDRLVSVTLDLHESRKRLHQTMCEKSQEDFHVAEQSSKNLLAAVIAGAKGDPTLLNLGD